jgi:hypothetical protein
LGDGNSKQWKLYNWLNIVNIFKKWLNFIWKTQKLSVQPNTYRHSFKCGDLTQFFSSSNDCYTSAIWRRRLWQTKLYVDRKIIYKRVLMKYNSLRGLEWIIPAQDRNQWSSLKNTAMNLWVP